MNNRNGEPLPPRSRGRWILLCGLVTVLWSSGCAHTHSRNRLGGGRAEMLLPKLTAMITGPAATLLTSGGGFQAEFTLSFEDAAEPPAKLSGMIFARGGTCLVEPAVGKSKSAPAAEFSVIWDAAAGKGYVLSDALQGCAPIASTVRFTNVLTEAVAGPPAQVEGHLVDMANATFMGNDGQTINFQLTRAQDLNHLPLLIHSLNQPGAFTLALAKIQLLMPAADLFLPPDGFTKYASETALLDELAARERSYFGGGHEHAGEAGEHSGQGGRRHNRDATNDEP